MYALPFRQAAIRIYNHLGNMKKASSALGIGIATLWRWINISMVPKERCREPSKLSTVILDYLNIYLKSHKTSTQVEIARELQKIFSISFSRQCIKCALNKIGFSRKRVSKRGVVKSQETYLTMLQKFKDNFNGSLVSIDEVGFDFRVVPTYGYSPKGSKCVLNTLTTKNHKRLSVIMAIDSKCSYAFKFCEHSVKSQHFNEFIKDVNSKWNYSTFIMDNASIHKSCLDANSTNKVLYTVPYTPECNPIENVFSTLKCYFRKRMVLNPPLETFQDYRTEILRILKSLDTSKLFKACFANTRKFLASKVTI